MTYTVELDPAEVQEAVREFIERRRDGKVTKIELAGMPSKSEFSPTGLLQDVTATCVVTQ